MFYKVRDIGNSCVLIFYVNMYVDVYKRALLFFSSPHFTTYNYFYIQIH